MYVKDTNFSIRAAVGGIDPKELEKDVGPKIWQMTKLRALWKAAITHHKKRSNLKAIGVWYDKMQNQVDDLFEKDVNSFEYIQDNINKWMEAVKLNYRAAVEDIERKLSKNKRLNFSLKSI